MKSRKLLFGCAAQLENEVTVARRLRLTQKNELLGELELELEEGNT